MPESEAGGQIPARQYTVIKLSTAAVALVLVVLIFAVGELFLLRATSRAQVRQLACFAIQHAPDTDPTVSDIRAAYRCPPPTPRPS